MLASLQILIFPAVYPALQTLKHKVSVYRDFEQNDIRRILAEVINPRSLAKYRIWDRKHS